MRPRTPDIAEEAARYRFVHHHSEPPQTTSTAQPTTRSTHGEQSGGGGGGDDGDGPPSPTGSATISTFADDGEDWREPPSEPPDGNDAGNRRRRRRPRLYQRIFKITLLVHLFSLFACVTSSHYASSHRSPPCKNFRFTPQQRHNISDQCTIWSDAAIPELCSAGTQSRIRMLRHIFLFPELQPLSLFELFAVGWKQENRWQLQAGENGNDCISGTINRCTACFQRLSGILRTLDKAYQSFDVTLSRFDCLPAVDTASATRPFSPNATCDNCKLWYRRWLLVQTLGIWNRPPCINWCYYTQLACPHLAPAKLWDYAGHPSFQCRDMDIDSWRQECDCVHPCDVRGIVSPGIIGNAPLFRHDFFAAQVHCETRKRECRTRSTAHDRRSSPQSSSSLSLSSSSSSSSSSLSTSSSSSSSSGGGEGRLVATLLLLLWML